MVEIPAWLKGYLSTGWLNVIGQLIWHVEQGQTVTVIRSDGPFEVPDILPGGVATLESVQYTFADGEGIALTRVLEKPG